MPVIQEEEKFVTPSRDNVLDAIVGNADKLVDLISKPIVIPFIMLQSFTGKLNEAALEADKTCRYSDNVIVAIMRPLTLALLGTTTIANFLAFGPVVMTSYMGLVSKKSIDQSHSICKGMTFGYIDFENSNRLCMGFGDRFSSDPYMEKITIGSDEKKSLRNIAILFMFVPSALASITIIPAAKAIVKAIGNRLSSVMSNLKSSAADQTIKNTGPTLTKENLDNLNKNGNNQTPTASMTSGTNRPTSSKTSKSSNDGERTPTTSTKR